jgi:hypothetical protein
MFISTRDGSSGIRSRVTLWFLPLLFLIAASVAVAAPATAAPRSAPASVVQPLEPPTDCSSTHYFQIQNRTRSGSTIKFNLIAINMWELMGTASGIVYYAVTDESNGNKTLVNSNGNISGNGPNIWGISFSLSAKNHALLVTWSVYSGNYDVCAGHQTINS